MKCLILAAGYATRLYPITKNFPKPLLSVGEKTVLDWLVDDIKECGLVDEFIIISNHRFFCHFDIWAKLKQQQCNDEVQISVVDDGTMNNETRLGAVKDIIFAMESSHVDDDCLIIAGDNVIDFSFGSFIDYAKKKKASCVMRYYEPDLAKISKSGCLQITDDDRILLMQEKPAEPISHWCCPPFYYYIREDMKRMTEAIEEGCGTDAPGSYVAWLCKQAPVYAFQMPGRRYDIGSVESYNQVNEDFNGPVRKQSSMVDK